MNTDFNFDDLSPAEVPVSISGKKYLLREATGDAACKWRNSLLRSTKLGPEGKPSSIEGMADSEPYLVSLCLFEQYEVRGEWKSRPVTLLQIRAWPARIVKALFEEAKRISGLDETETEEILIERIKDAQQKLSMLRSKRSEREYTLGIGREGDHEPGGATSSSNDPNLSLNGEETDPTLDGRESTTVGLDSPRI